MTHETTPLALQGYGRALLQTLPLPAPTDENLPHGNFSGPLVPSEQIAAALRQEIGNEISNGQLCEVPAPGTPDTIEPRASTQEPRPIADTVDVTNILPRGDNIEPKPASKPSTHSGPRTRRGEKGATTNAVPGGQYCTEKFAECTALGREWVTVESNATIRNANLLQSVAQFVDDAQFKMSDFKALCASRNLACTKATIRAGYFPVIKAVYEDIGRPISNPQASKLNAALKWSKSECKHNEDIAKYLQEHGGVQGCLKERAAAKGKKPKSRGTQALKVANFLAGHEGEVVVVLKVNGENVEFVRLIGPASTSQPPVTAVHPPIDREEFPAEPASEEISDAGDTADDAVQVRPNETEEEE